MSATAEKKVDRKEHDPEEAFEKSKEGTNPFTPRIVGGTDVEEAQDNENLVVFPDIGDTGASTLAQRASLDFDDEEIAEDIGPAPKQERKGDHMVLSFALKDKYLPLLEGLSEARVEGIPIIIRKIIEHKVFRDVTPPENNHRTRVHFSASQKLRDEIEAILEGTGIKRTEFLAMQLEEYLEEKGADNDPAP